MMKTWTRLIAALLLMATCLSALIACNKKPSGNLSDDPDDFTFQTPADDPDTSTSQAPTDDSSEGIRLEPANAMILIENEKTDYVIIRDDTASDNVVSKITDFRNRFWTKTGVDMKIEKDTTLEKPKEIIVSMMDGRTQSAKEYAKLTAPQGKGYRISIVGKSIVVASQEEYLTEALELLMMAICDCGNGIWGVPKEYEGEMDIPALPENGVLYDVGEGNYAYNVNNVTKTTVDGYLTSLKEDGFEIYSQHSVGESKFATYIKDSIYGQMVVHTMYYPKVRKFRLTYGPMEYLPNVTEQREAGVANPTITQMYLERVDTQLELSGLVVTANNCAPGMSYLIQLSDGRFIVIDGGKADGTFQKVTQDANGYWVAAPAKQSADAERLYDTMVSMKPADHDKPHIAAWFMSHAHGDHMSLAIDFLADYKGKIELELVAFNMPTSADLPDWNKKSMDTFESNAKTLYGAEVWTMHTGQVMQLPGATIEVLSTVEDTYCEWGSSLFSDLNNACAIFRIHIGESSFMVLGDAYPAAGQFMAEAYGNALQSDIMQVAHHGANGGVLRMYQLVDPKICLWPCDEYRFYMDSRMLGTDGGYDFNYWLRYNNWKRDTFTGVRRHYTGSFTTTIDANTGKVLQSV